MRWTSGRGRDRLAHMSERETARTPEDITRLFVERANAKDAAGLAALYEHQTEVVRLRRTSVTTLVHHESRSRRGRLALRQRPAPHRSCLRLRGALRRVQPVHADVGSRRA